MCITGQDSLCCTLPCWLQHGRAGDSMVLVLLTQWPAGHTKVPACLPTFTFGKDSTPTDNQSTYKSFPQLYHVLWVQAGPRSFFFTKYRLSWRVWLSCFDLWQDALSYHSPLKPTLLLWVKTSDQWGLSSVFAFISKNHGEEWSFLSYFLPLLHRITCTAVQGGTGKELQTLHCFSPLNLAFLSFYV